MSTSIKLSQLESRISELEELASAIDELAIGLRDGKEVQPQLVNTVQKWYRGARELFVQHNFTGLKEFDNCYRFHIDNAGHARAFSDIEQYSSKGLSSRSKPTSSQADHYLLFKECFLKARALLHSTLEELKSRELPFKTQLSFAVSSSEFDTARELIDASSDEPIARASGVIARVALERHLLTVADMHKVPIQINPPNKKKADTQDVLTSLVKAQILTPIQKSELDSLFAIGNNCAHPKEAVNVEDVHRLIERGRELASLIV